MALGEAALIIAAQAAAIGGCCGGNADHAEGLGLRNYSPFQQVGKPTISVGGVVIHVCGLVGYLTAGNRT